MTTLDIPDLREGLAKEKADKAAESDSDSDEGYGDEDEPAQEAPKEAEEKIKPKEGKYSIHY